MRVGDKVRVVLPVWDKERSANWVNHEGIIQCKAEDGFYDWTVLFPDIEGELNDYEFLERELEVIYDS